MNTPTPPGKNIGKGMLTIGWILLLVALTYFFGNWEKQQYNPNNRLTNSGEGNTTEVTLERNRYNHYVANGKVNQHAVVFMLDTGASHVSVPANIANKLNLKKGTQGRAITANGTVTVWQTTISILELGPIVLHNVRASINPGMQGEEILLGMSALKQLDFSQNGKFLTLKQYH